MLPGYAREKFPFTLELRDGTNVIIRPPGLDLKTDEEYLGFFCESPLAFLLQTA